MINSTVQTILVAIILLAAIAWSIKRIFFDTKGGCDCGCVDGECSCGIEKNCSGCQLKAQCTKKKSDICNK